MIKFFKQFFCNHNWVWKQNVYGDAINVLECRSIWEHYNSKTKNKVEYLEPQSLGPTGSFGKIGPVGFPVNHNIKVE